MKSEKENNNFYENDNIASFPIRDLNLFTEFKKYIPYYNVITIKSITSWGFSYLLRICNNKYKCALKLSNKIRELQSRITYKSLESKIRPSFYTRIIEIVKENKEFQKFLLNTISFDDCDFSFRTFACLRKNKITTYKQLFDLSHMQLLNMHNLGIKSTKEIELYKLSTYDYYYNK